MSRLQDVQEPNEIEAWKLMMDSLIKFISASTKLMNTITQKAQQPDAVPAPSGQGQLCEVECITCQPTRTGCKPCAARGSVVAPPAQDVGGVCPNICPGIGGATQPTDQPGGAPPPAKNGADGAPPAEDAPAAGGDDAPPPSDEAPPAKDAVAGDEAAQAPPQDAAAPAPPQDAAAAPAPPQDAVPAGNKDDLCVCAEIRRIKQTAAEAGVAVDQGDQGAKRGSCSCSGKKKTASEQQLCSCPPGPKEKEKMTKELADKLNKAQEEINSLQQEMQRLQQLQASRTIKSAALYKEIMKDSSFDRAKTLPEYQAPGQMVDRRSLQGPPQGGCGQGRANGGGAAKGCPCRSSGPSARPPRSFMATMGSPGPRPNLTTFRSQLPSSDPSTQYMNLPGASSSGVIQCVYRRPPKFSQYDLPNFIQANESVPSTVSAGRCTSVCSGYKSGSFPYQPSSTPRAPAYQSLQASSNVNCNTGCTIYGPASAPPFRQQPAQYGPGYRSLPAGLPSGVKVCSAPSSGGNRQQMQPSGGYDPYQAPDNRPCVCSDDEGYDYDAGQPMDPNQYDDCDDDNCENDDCENN